MTWEIILDIIGYVGSALIVISMMMTSMVKLRVFNCCGCVVTIFYSIMISSYPVLALNALLLIVNLYQLFKHYTRIRNYDVIDAEVAGFTLKHFLNMHRQQIRTQNPMFFHRYPDSNYAKVAYCDDAVVGMIVGRREGDTLEVYMDYLDPNFRKDDFVAMIHENIHNDGIKTEIFKDIPAKYQDLYLKAGCKQEGKDFVADLNKKFGH